MVQPCTILKHRCAPALTRSELVSRLKVAKGSQWKVPKLHVAVVAATYRLRSHGFIDGAITRGIQSLERYSATNIYRIGIAERKLPNTVTVGTKS
ncbi:hypothetical protein C8Q73DRAFT_133793 [Cubamyces lactineus]|nr:hypothetical protein C8Q73DRAFT_133793 [Cubamyces lactineus]